MDIYIRVSQRNGRSGDSFISPPDQEKKCRALAAMRGYEVDRVFTDIDHSGGTMDRPEFARVMERITSGVSDGVIVAKLDRFARNVAGLLTEVDRIEQAGGVFACVEPTIDTGDPVYGRFLLTLFGAIAEMELGRIKAGWADVHENHIARGIQSGPAPLGYSKDDDGRFLANEHADTVRAAFDLRLKGANYHEVARLLDERKAPRRKAPYWTAAAARKLIQNRVYRGEVRFGEIVQPGAHEALVDEDTFILANRKEPRSSGARGRGILLGGGLCRCGTCGEALVEGKTKAGGKTYPILRCRGGSQCSRGVAIMISKLEPYLVQKAVETSGLNVEIRRKQKPQQKEKLAEAEKALLALDQLKDSGTISETEWLALRPARELAVSEARYDEPDLPSWDLDPERLPELLKKDVSVGRWALKQALGRVVVKPGRGTMEERVEVFPAGPS